MHWIRGARFLDFLDGLQRQIGKKRSFISFLSRVEFLARFKKPYYPSNTMSIVDLTTPRGTGKYCPVTLWRGGRIPTRCRNTFLGPSREMHA